jgi:hypothetical protein
MATPALSWEEAVARKRAIRDASIKKYLPSSKSGATPLPQDLESGDLGIPYYSAKTKSITEIGELTVLQSMIAEGKVSAEDVVSAYIERYVAL